MFMELDNYSMTYKKRVDNVKYLEFSINFDIFLFSCTKNVLK